MEGKWHRKIWKHVAGPVWMVCDPITRVCKPALRQHWDRKYKHHGHLAPAVLIFDLVLLSLLGMVVVGGIFALFILPALPKPGIVRLELKAPTETESGRGAEFEISYANETGRVLGCPVLVLHVPDMFDVAEANRGPAVPCETASPLEQDVEVGPDDLTRNLPDIPVGGLGTLAVTGTDYGRPGSVRSADVQLFFWEEGKTEATRVISRAEWSIVGSTVQLSFEPEAELARGRRARFAITYKNDVGYDAPLRIALQTPADFRLISSTPSQSGPKTWDIEAKEPGEGVIMLTGVLLTSANPTPPAFTVSVYEQNERPRLLNEIRVNTDARAAGFELTQDLTAALTHSLFPGEEETVTVRYRNGGDQAIKDLRIFLEADPRVIESVSPAGLRWDRETNPELASVEPGAQGEFTATFKVRTAFDEQLLAQGHPELSIAARAEYFLADAPNRPVEADTAVETLPISTLLKVHAAAFYYTTDGEQLGIGPLPPKVGQKTKYRAVIYVTNTTNEVEDVWFEAYLPANVAWTGRYSVTAGESMDYFASTGRVRWKVGKVQAYEDGTGERVGASFEVELTPGEDDAGKVPLLVRDIQVTGVDTVTRAKLTATTEDVTTDLPFDPRAKGKGEVQK